MVALSIRFTLIASGAGHHYGTATTGQVCLRNSLIPNLNTSEGSKCVVQICY